MKYTCAIYFILYGSIKAIPIHDAYKSPEGELAFSFCSSHLMFYVPEAYILHFTNSCYFSQHICLPVQFSKFGSCLQNIRGVYPKRPWNIVISSNNLAGLYTQSVCDEDLRISCIFFCRFSLRRGL